MSLLERLAKLDRKFIGRYEDPPGERNPARTRRWAAAGVVLVGLPVTIAKVVRGDNIILVVVSIVALGSLIIWMMDRTSRGQ